MEKKSTIGGIENPEYREFLKILQANKRRIFGFIFACVPHYSTAEDIMQDTIIRLWSKFSTYTPGTNFAAWGISYSKYIILEHQRKDCNIRLQFDSDALDNLVKPFENDKDMDTRVEALQVCLDKLPEIQKQLVQMRYADKLTVKEIALKVGRPVHGLYKALMKIQGSLQQCIEGALKRWDMA